MRILVVALLIAIAGREANTQQIDLGGAGPAQAGRRQHVELISDAIVVNAGKPQDVDVVFRVDPGFHINSHQPKDELLIPTSLKLEGLRDVKLLSDQYPKGAPFQIAVGSDVEVLDVYTGEFRVGLRVVAPRGISQLTGTLHYQACDNAACFPPRNLPVTLTLTAK